MVPVIGIVNMYFSHRPATELWSKTINRLWLLVKLLSNSHQWEGKALHQCFKTNNKYATCSW